MKNPLFSRLCALALALMLVVPAFAQAEAIEPSEGVVSPMIEAAIAEEGSLSLSGPVVESNHTIEDDEEYELHSKSKSAKCDAGNSFTIELGDDCYGKNWKSSNKNVAKVDGGYVTCLKAGTAKISVDVYDYDKGKKSGTRTLTLTVNNGKGGFTIVYEDDDADDTYRFKDGETWNTYPGWNVTLRAERAGEEEDDIKWTTSKKKYVEIDSETGELKALKPGKSKITAEAPNGMKTSITINVKKNSGSNSNLSKSRMQSDANSDQEVLFGVKSVSVASTTSVTVTFVLFNGTDTKISKLKDLDISVTASDSVHEGEMVSGTFSTVKVKCNKRSNKEFKLTFKGDDVQEAFWWLAEPAFSAEADASYSE